MARSRARKCTIPALVGLILTLIVPIPTAAAEDAAESVESQDLRLSGLSDEQVSRGIADDCTKTSAEILATIQGLQGRQEFTTVRHRGDFSATVPENSLTAFEHSYLKCRPGIETDLRRTADDVLVMFHDTHIGKMLEPSYNPLTNAGPNARLDSLTWSQLESKTLLDINRQPVAGAKVPRFEDFLEHYVRVGGRSLLYVEIKNTGDKANGQNEVMDAVEQVVAFHRSNPNAKIFDKVVFKFRMSLFPTFDQWQTRLSRIPNLPRTPLSQVMTSRQIARDIRSDASMPGSTPVGDAARSWAKRNATSDGVLSVEVTMKDSINYMEQTLRTSDAATPPFRGMQYYAPSDGVISVAAPETMADVTGIVRQNGKPLGQFVPIPDWVMFRSPGTFEWDRILPNVDAGYAKVPVTPKEAYFNNNSACCYALRDRVDSSVERDREPEQNDQRIILPWLEDIGATILTADDTDSVDFYFDGRNKKLDAGDNRRSPNAPDPAMNSLIYPGSSRLPSLMKYVTVTSIAPKGSTSTQWWISATVSITEAGGTYPETTRSVGYADRTTGDGPISAHQGLAIYGDGAIYITVARNTPSEKPPGTPVTIPIADAMPDGVYSTSVNVADGPTVLIHYSVSRQWAVMDQFRARVPSDLGIGAVWGEICVFTPHAPTVSDKCLTGDFSEQMAGYYGSSWPVHLGPGGTDLPFRERTVVAGARRVYLYGWLRWTYGGANVDLSRGYVRMDQPTFWGERVPFRLPSKVGPEVEYSYRLTADGGRVPL